MRIAKGTQLQCFPVQLLSSASCVPLLWARSIVCTACTGWLGTQHRSKTLSIRTRNAFCAHLFRGRPHAHHRPGPALHHDHGSRFPPKTGHFCKLHMVLPGVAGRWVLRRWVY